MLFSPFQHYLDLYITDTALKVSQCLYCFTTSVSHGVETISPGCGVWAPLVLFFVKKISNETVKLHICNSLHSQAIVTFRFSLLSISVET